ncbi:transglycosylase SLT domain protein [Mycobacterium xenopi 4042]|uniref:Transglycosylase SLT domain protein n=1 Tax=Mycobacterium xenopi 4042 TaxID=1299334 RepID=X7ZXD1_MYCXE|nr:transglycosylase SLT domain protein [Mycobacterium xenopi 4042]
MLLDDYDRNVDARRQLTAMARVQDTLPAWRIEPPPPADELLGYYHEAESQSGVGWNYLAAINLIETRFGSINGVSTAGAQGPMQFLPSTFAAYAEGGDIHSPATASWQRAASSPRMALPTTMIGHLPVQPRERIRAGGRPIRGGACRRSHHVRRLLPVGRLLRHERGRRAAAHRLRRDVTDTGRRLPGKPPAVTRRGVACRLFLGAAMTFDDYLAFSLRARCSLQRD